MWVDSQAECTSGLKCPVTAQLDCLVRKCACYQEDRRLCPLLCSSGSQRWCSLKQWRTWGKAMSTHPTLCCSSLLTTDRLIRRSPVTELLEINCFWHYIICDGACQIESIVIKILVFFSYCSDSGGVAQSFDFCDLLCSDSFALSLSCDPHE